MRTYLFGLTVAATLLAPLASATADSNEDRKSAQQVADNLKQSGLLKDYRVGVKYRDGVAWLSGTVTDEQQRATAEQIARRSAGVEQVLSNLTIQPAPQAERMSKSLKRPRSAQESHQARDGLQKPTLDDSVEPAAGQNDEAQPAAPQLASRLEWANHHMANQTAMRAARPVSLRNAPLPYARSGQGVHPTSYGAPSASGAMPMPAGGGRAVSYDNPQMPGYAWPSYAASPNYAALSYPQQYSPSAWPYIGPFYPYPQVPLGWRKVTLEWDDGWWFLDFKDSRGSR